MTALLSPMKFYQFSKKAPNVFLVRVVSAEKMEGKNVKLSESLYDIDLSRFR